MSDSWSAILKMPWRTRNALVAQHARAALAAIPKAQSMDTFELGTRMAGVEYAAPVSKLLARMAPHLEREGICTHDGEEIVRYKRKWRRWRWHGQGANGAG